jgi:hypothetical protein
MTADQTSWNSYSLTLRVSTFESDVFCPGLFGINGLGASLVI